MAILHRIIITGGGGGEYSIKPPLYGSVNLKAFWVFQTADVTNVSVPEYEQ